MNPIEGVVGWLIIGALTGWLASNIMRMDPPQRGAANLVVGMIGALVGGLVTRSLFGSDVANSGLAASFGGALLGACLTVFVWKTLAGRRA